MTNSQFELQVLVGNKPIKEYAHQGKVYVEGRKGQYFTLKFRNNSFNRVLVIPSVDGLCAVDGQPATASSRGYVVPGCSSFEIKGWRESLEGVSSFIFKERDASYVAAAQSGDTSNCGVIAAMVIAEKVKSIPLVINNPPVEHHHHHHHTHYPWWPHYPIYYCSSTFGDPKETFGDSNVTYSCSVGGGGTTSSAAPVGGDMMRCANNVASENVLQALNAALADKTPDFNLGAGWGEKVDDRVSETEFERGSQLALLEVYFSDAAGLSRAGIQLTKEVAVSKQFPQSFGGFCKSPIELTRG